MILLSVGTQLPFSRLVDAVDLWAERNRDVRVVGQIGPQKHGLPQHIESFDFKPIAEFEQLQQQSRGRGLDFDRDRFSKTDHHHAAPRRTRRASQQSPDGYCQVFHQHAERVCRIGRVRIAETAQSPERDRFFGG